MPGLGPHLRYAWFIIEHKLFVFRAGLETVAPIWRLVIHDWSKMSPTEWGPYVRKFYDPARNVEAEFNRAWLHHQHRNPHHWQHWLLQEDDGPLLPLEIPEPLVREMVADWAGAARAITGRWDLADWYADARNRMILAPHTQRLADALVQRMTQ